ncbi:S9 family peptidase [Lichenicola cladoniae]|uniref:S9 family peptidase n=1 Tax=Lichenicola cladoniae TaxID=1484109 RepID=A0A6M8HQK9_9PROT|nr:S9 family peptidase [Lichenicola cladoniae]NPD67965.1 S9 family peptidase [Acetobacteraceae bacterium]QKE90555.1 S9 family peptidase [Lichenicola cladoniae]
MTDQPTPPVARKEPRSIDQLGRVRVDPYAWMKDENWQAVLRDPSALRGDIATHLRQENLYAETLLAPTKPLQATILEEMKGRLKQDETSLAVPDGAWSYYARYEPGAQHAIRARRPRDAETGPASHEEILLDVQALSLGHDYYVVAAAHHSPDHRLYAYAEDAQGSEVYRIQVKDLSTGETLTGPVESSTGDFTFSPDSAWLFWTYRDEHGRPTRIYRRPSRGGEDVLVYEETDPGFFIGVQVSESRAWIMITCGDQETTETLLIPGDDPTATPRVAAPRRKGERYSLTHWHDRFIVHTNAGDAIDFKLMQTPVNDPGREAWRDWVPQRPGHFIIGASAFAGHLAWIERRDVNNRILIVPITHASDPDIRSVATEIKVDEDAYLLALDGSYEFDTKTLRTSYQSPTTPRHWYDNDMETGTRTLRKVQEIPSGHDSQLYVTRRLQAIAPDGASVPITVLMRRDTPVDGTAPLLLYGYGSYGHAIEAGFSTRTLSLVDRGWIYAIAHVRGGSEKGWGWFLDGRGRTKPNSFTDFVAVARHLAAEGYGSEGGIVAHGASAGGLLMGAVANLAPELFAGIVAQVPFVDMLNTMSDTSLPLTPPEWPEWGNPIEDEAAYDLIASYSPYDNLHAVAYPTILAMGGLSDPRVTYWEPAKWAAALRDASTGTNPILCRINMESGHGGASGRFDSLKEAALVQAFAIWAWERRGAST